MSRKVAEGKKNTLYCSGRHKKRRRKVFIFDEGRRRRESVRRINPRRDLRSCIRKGGGVQEKERGESIIPQSV